MNEFELIARYFDWPSGERQGVGDDCALIDLGERTIAITSDLLIEDRHFFPGTDPASLGHKALAVSLSDLAAAGARPRCFVLSLALACADPDWLRSFSAAMQALAQRQACALVGGDTTRSPDIGGARGATTIGVTAIGEVDRRFLRGRAGAGAGDDLWVCGELGDAALAVAHRRGELELSPADARDCGRRLDWPEARVELGIGLRGIATAAIDVSDGLIADLGHLLARSGLGAVLNAPDVPRSTLMRRMPARLQQRCVFAGGDDYELLFAARASDRPAVMALAQSLCIAITLIGSFTYDLGLKVLGAPDFDATLRGYDHFADAAGPPSGEPTR